MSSKYRRESTFDLYHESGLLIAFTFSQTWIDEDTAQLPSYYFTFLEAVYMSYELKSKCQGGRSAF